MRICSVIIAVVICCSCSKTNKYWYKVSNGNVIFYEGDKQIKQYTIKDADLYKYEKKSLLLNSNVCNEDSIDCKLIEMIDHDTNYLNRIGQSIDIGILNDLYNDYLKISYGDLIKDTSKRNQLIEYIRSTQFAFFDTSFKFEVHTQFDSVEWNSLNLIYSNNNKRISYHKGDKYYFDENGNCICDKQTVIYRQLLTKTNNNTIYFVIEKESNYNRRAKFKYCDCKELFFRISFFPRNNKILFKKELLNPEVLNSYYFKINSYKFSDYYNNKEEYGKNWRHLVNDTIW